MEQAPSPDSLYKGKLMAGPMVRGSCLTFRLSCLDYGADIVFSPGLVDLAISSSMAKNEDGWFSLIKNENGKERRIFLTSPEEKGKLIIQIVTADGPNAQKAANVIDGVAAGYDINCGCPEDFACHRGGGSKMTLERAVDVVETLKRNFQTPISIKMRIKDTLEESIQFAQAVEKAGACAITVHGRIANDKRKGGPDYVHMKKIFDSVNCAKIGNGGVASLDDAALMKEKTGCDSIMICSAALKNPSVFSSSRSSKAEVLSRYYHKSTASNQDLFEAKFIINQILNGSKDNLNSLERTLPSIKTWDEFHTELAKYL